MLNCLKTVPSAVGNAPTVGRLYPCGIRRSGHRLPARQTRRRALDLSAMADTEKLKLLSDSIRVIPDFPKPGVLFQDVTTILLHPDAFQASIDLLEKRYKDMNVDVIAGFEARGLIFGAPLALALKVPFVPLRKPGKLPGKTVSVEYKTEYSTDKIEMHVGAVQPGQRVLLIDDLVATGGTLVAGAELIRLAGGLPIEAACVIELPELEGRSKLGDLPLYVLVQKAGV